VIQRKLSFLVPVGLVMLCAALVISHWTHGGYSHFAGGFLLGAGLVFIIGGFVRKPQGPSV
jgi:hypothetical protein